MRRKERLQQSTSNDSQNVGSALQGLIDAHENFINEPEEDRGRHPFFDRIDEDCDELFAAAIEGICRSGDYSFVSLVDRDEDNRTLLHMTAYFGLQKSTAALIKVGSDINSKTLYHETPLHVAARKGFLDIVKELYVSGADIDAINDDSESAIDVARVFGQEDIVKYLEGKKRKRKRDAEN